MYTVHKEKIKNFTEKMKADEEVLAVIIGGSIAHGFETETSDVDVMVVVSEDNFQNRLKMSTVQFLDKEVGSIDGKYISVEFMKKIEQYGSEPSRYAFKGAFVAYTKITGLEVLISTIQKYPIELKQDKMNRLYAQFMAWNWYCKNAIKKDNLYLLNMSVSNLALFGGRLILAHNETLYPCHKWFTRVLSNVQSKPEMLIESMEEMIRNKSAQDIENFYVKINEFKKWDETGIRWPNIFLNDSEWNWVDGKTPVADI